MLLIDTGRVDLRMTYTARSYGDYPFSALRSVGRHVAWLAEYVACGDVDLAGMAWADLEAIRTELSED